MNSKTYKLRRYEILGESFYADAKDDYRVWLCETGLRQWFDFPANAKEIEVTFSRSCLIQGVLVTPAKVWLVQRLAESLHHPERNQVSCVSDHLIRKMERWCFARKLSGDHEKVSLCRTLKRTIAKDLAPNSDDSFWIGVSYREVAQ